MADRTFPTAATLASVALLCSGCAINGTFVGLVAVDDARVALMQQTGRDLILHHPTDQEQLKHLAGCGLEASGLKIGRHIVVEDWHVTATTDGTEPFIGRLEQFGSTWVLHDRNTGRKLTLDASQLGALPDHEGNIVMVSGYVIGDQTIRVVGYKVLQN